MDTRVYRESYNQSHTIVIVLYCTVSYCIVPYRTVLYRTAPYCKLMEHGRYRCQDSRAMWDYLALYSVHTVPVVPVKV